MPTKEKIVKVADFIQKEVEAGLYSKDNRLPSEAELCQRFLTNRYTVRQALDRLIQVGLIRAEKGVGYFVVNPPLNFHYEVSPLTRFSDIIRRAGNVPGAELQSKKVVLPHLQVKDTLGLTREQEVYHLEIIRYADEIPVAKGDTFLPCFLFEDLEKYLHNFHSLYHILESDYGVYPKRLASTFQAVYPNAKEAIHLDISPNTPLLQIESVMCDQRGNRMEFTRAKFRGDLCNVSVGF
ncbi:GntR family transcriptional regulator [Thalassobacillus sp. C254]|uniref:GntR family transcriptional regulator n=1 Tax=Thalassobacillus sp. C254 TaxID=1225341 RepID=UPI0006D252C9|nr:GntR family transcriptional regulator [Thalassobacillus sp. C254]